jgi:hypothetical protein
MYSDQTGSTVTSNMYALSTQFMYFIVQGPYFIWKPTAVKFLSASLVYLTLATKLTAHKQGGIEAGSDKWLLSYEIMTACNVM